MLGSLKRHVALATAAGFLGLAGTALAAGPASAAQYNLTKYAGGPSVAAGTAYTASTNLIEFTNSSGAVYAKCTGTSTLSGATNQPISGDTAPSSGLTVTGGSFNTCTVAGSSVTVTGSYSPAWQVTPTGGTSSPFTGTVSNIKVTLQCSATSSATFTGTLGTGGQEVNQTSGSQIVLSNAQSLTKSGSGCPTIPSTVGVTGTYTLTTVGGSAVSSTNNLWENYS